MTGRQQINEPPETSSGSLAAASIAFFLVIVASTAINVATGPIRAAFGSSVSGWSWIVDAYLLTFAAFLLSAGALGDRIGARRVFKAGFVVFMLGAALCAGAQSIAALVCGQAIAGLGAAMLVPTSLALINHAYPAAAPRATAIGIWAAAGGAAIAAGPVVGGVVVEGLGWRALFGSYLPIAGTGLMLAMVCMEDPPRSAGRGLDPGGQAAAVVSLGALTFTLIEGASRGWSSAVILLSASITGVAALAFVLVEHRGRSPMLPLSLFQRRAVGAASAIGLLLNFAYYGQVFVLGLFFQTAKNFTPLTAGLAFLPMTASVMISNLAAGRLTARFGARVVVVAGLSLASTGFFALAFVSVKTAYWVIALLLLPAGIGAGLVVPPITSAVLGAVPKERAGVASGLLNASRQLGGVVGVALFGAMMATWVPRDAIGAADVSLPGFRLAVLTAGAALASGCAAALLLDGTKVEQSGHDAASAPGPKGACRHAR